MWPVRLSNWSNKHQQLRPFYSNTSIPASDKHCKNIVTPSHSLLGAPVCGSLTEFLCWSRLTETARLLKNVFMKPVTTAHVPIEVELKHGYAFSQEEHGVVPQADLIRAYDSTKMKPKGVWRPMLPLERVRIIPAPQKECPGRGRHRGSSADRGVYIASVTASESLCVCAWM